MRLSECFVVVGESEFRKKSFVQGTYLGLHFFRWHFDIWETSASPNLLQVPILTLLWVCRKTEEASARTHRIVKKRQTLLLLNSLSLCF